MKEMSKIGFTAYFIFLFSLVLCVSFIWPQAQATQGNFRSVPDYLARSDSTAQPSTDYRQRLESLVTEEKPKEEMPFEVDSYYQFMPSSGVDAMSGKVGLMHSAQEYSYEAKAFGKLPLEFSLETSYIGIHNSTEVKLPAHLNGLSAGIEATVPFFNFDKTYFRFGVFPSCFDDGLNFHSSSFRLPSRYFVIYQPNEKLTLVLGVAYYPDFEDEVLPIIGLIYKPNDRLSFNIIPRRPNISYKLNDKFAIFWEFGSTSGEYEVAKGDVKNAVLKYNELFTGAGIKYRANKNINASLSVGGAFDRQLKYRDSLGKVNIDNGLYTEFRLDIKM